MQMHSSTNFVRPVRITSPISGGQSTPRIVKTQRGDKIYTEAHWYCPDSGQYIRKGIVSIEDVKKTS
jgi:hypothetical protein